MCVCVWVRVCVGVGAAAGAGQQHVHVCMDVCTHTGVEREEANTFNNGSLGSCIDEERSNVRKVMRIA